MKPPVVVVERHCKTNQCWIAVRFKKIKSVAKISQSAAEERADTPWQMSSTGGVAEYFRHACARHSRKFSFLRAPSFFTLAMGEKRIDAPQSTAPTNARTPSRAAISLIFRRPLAERAIAAAPTRLAWLQAAADQQRPRPRRQLPDSLPLPGSETAAPIATSWCNSASTTDRIA